MRRLFDHTDKLEQGSHRICSKQEFCAIEVSGDRGDYIDWSNKYSLKNWIRSLGLYCSSSFEIGLYGSLFFFGYLSSCLVFPPMADIYGRKIFVIIVCIVQGLCFLVLLLIPNPIVYYATIFIFGTSIPLKNMMAYTHLMEFLPGRVTEYSGYLFFTEGMLLVISPLILIFVTVNTDIFLWVGLIQNGIGIALFIFMYVPESTIFLLEKERFEEAKNDIAYLLKFNRATEAVTVEMESCLTRYIEKTRSLMERKIKE